MSHLRAGYCWRTYCHATELWLLLRILLIPGPSMMAYARHNFRHLGFANSIGPFCETGKIEFISICGRSSRGSNTWRTRRSTSVGCGSTISIAVSSAVAASKTEAASGRGRLRSGEGHLLCPASCRARLPRVAAHGLIEINSMVWARRRLRGALPARPLFPPSPTLR